MLYFPACKVKEDKADRANCRKEESLVRGEGGSIVSIAGGGRSLVHRDEGRARRSELLCREGDRHRRSWARLSEDEPPPVERGTGEEGLVRLR